ncbi:MAG: VOC family protein [Candidatus Eremiobacteraeota bacterium]|nr:VOC family protein [Candidatus Eremiobacteraeota bacterium]
MNATSSMTLTRLVLGVSDIETSERFYRELLGLPTQRSGDTVTVRWPAFTLELHERPPSDRGKFSFGFQVGAAADVDMWAQRLRAARVDIVSGPATHGSSRSLFCVDPDNYEIEIFFAG